MAPGRMCSCSPRCCSGERGVACALCGVPARGLRGGWSEGWQGSGPLPTPHFFWQDPLECLRVGHDVGGHLECRDLTTVHRSRVQSRRSRLLPAARSASHWPLGSQRRTWVLWGLCLSLAYTRCFPFGSRDVGSLSACVYSGFVRMAVALLCGWA